MEITQSELRRHKRDSQRALGEYRARKFVGSKVGIVLLFAAVIPLILVSTFISKPKPEISLIASVSALGLGGAVYA